MMKVAFDSDYRVHRALSANPRRKSPSGREDFETLDSERESLTGQAQRIDYSADAEEYTAEVPMLIHELTKDECLDVLRHTNLGRLACSHDDQPYIVPIYFDFDGEDVYSFATKGTKTAWMESNSKVCLEVDDIIDHHNWMTVLVFGRYEELTEMPQYEELRDRARQLFQKRPEWWLPAAGKVSSEKEFAPIVYRIRIATVSGRRAARDETAAAAASRRSRPRSDIAPPWWVQVLDPLLAKHRQ